MPDADRPNLDALRRALDVYRDAMRQFIARELDRAFGEDGATGAAAAALEGQRRAEFETDLREGQSLADALRFDDIPPIVRAHLADAFAESLGGRAGASERLSLIANARDVVMNPPVDDIGGGEASAWIQDIAQVLDRAGADGAARDVRGVGASVKLGRGGTDWIDRVREQRWLSFLGPAALLLNTIFFAVKPLSRIAGLTVDAVGGVWTVVEADPWVGALTLTIILGAAIALLVRSGWRRRPAVRPVPLGWLAAGARRLRERGVVLGVVLSIVVLGVVVYRSGLIPDRVVAPLLLLSFWSLAAPWAAVRSGAANVVTSWAAAPAAAAAAPLAVSAAVAGSTYFAIEDTYRGDLCECVRAMPAAAAPASTPTATPTPIAAPAAAAPSPTSAAVLGTPAATGTPAPSPTPTPTHDPTGTPSPTPTAAPAPTPTTTPRTPAATAAPVPSPTAAASAPGPTTPVATSTPAAPTSTPAPAAPAGGSVSAAERAALVALYHATDGPNWRENTNWLSDRPAAEWRGVTVEGNAVTELRLEQNFLSGELPPELGGLAGLTHLSIESRSSLRREGRTIIHRLTGEIPREVFDLTGLTHLSLYGDFTGEIPPEVGNLTNLAELQLSGQFTGEIPPELGNLTNLTELQLSGQFTGAIPQEVFGLTRLTSLRLSGQFTTKIPRAVGNLTNLSVLNLNGSFRGGAPPAGEIPREVFDLTRLTELSLDGDFTGEIPPEVGNLTNLTALSIRGNFSGQIPLVIEEFTNLETLRLWGSFTGEIPQVIFDFSNLESLSLKGQFVGEIPDRIGTLTNLRDLHLDGDFTGEIPSTVDRLNNLTFLVLQGRFTGEIPRRLSSLTNLHILRLYGEFTAGIPHGLGNLDYLQTLALHGEFTGEIPRDLGNLNNPQFPWASLRVLELSGNFTGTIPRELGNLAYLERLRIFGSFRGETPLSGCIPSALQYVPELSVGEPDPLPFCD